MPPVSSLRTARVRYNSLEKNAGLQRGDGVAHERYGQGAHADDHFIRVALFGHFVGGHVAGLGAAGVDGDTSGHDE